MVEQELREVSGSGLPYGLFTDEYSALAPVGYPAVHYLTAPIADLVVRMLPDPTPPRYG
jgi:hypothetical protein